MPFYIATHHKTYTALRLQEVEPLIELIRDSINYSLKELSKNTNPITNILHPSPNQTYLFDVIFPSRQ